MANFLSTILTARDSKVISNAPEYVGRLAQSSGLLTLSVEPSVSDVLMYVDIPSNAVLTVLDYYGDAVDSGALVEVDWGIYAGDDFSLASGVQISANQVLNAVAFGAGSDTLQAAHGPDPVHLRFINGADKGNVSTVSLQMWQLANLTEDPFVNLRIGASVSVGFDTFAAGSTLALAQWVGKV